MTTLHEFGRSLRSSVSVSPIERRKHRRHDLEPQTIRVERCDGKKDSGEEFGQLVDLSSGGMRIRTSNTQVRPDQQLRLRIELPPFAGISPFVDTSTGKAKPRSEWVGWMTVARVNDLGGNQVEVGGRLVGMDDLDRGMLGLYLSTQPLAA